MPSRRQVLAGFGAVGVGATAGCLGDGYTEAAASDSDGTSDGDGTGDWPMAHFDTMARSYNPNTVAPTEEPTERWNAEVGWMSNRPVVADGTVYVASVSHLHAFDVESGDERWNVGPTEDTETREFTSPAVQDGTVYVGVDEGDAGLLALDADDGKEKWRYELDGGQPYVDLPPTPDYIEKGDWEGIVVADGDDVVHYVDLETQEARWTFEVYGTVTRLATRSETVFVGTEGGEVYGLYDGEGMWRQKLPGKITALALGPHSGDVFASTFGGGVFHLRSGLHAGRTAWHAAEGPVAHEALVVTDDHVCGTDLANATVLNRESGETQWEVDGDFSAPPAGAGDTLYLGGETGVTAYEFGGGVGLGDLRFGGKRWHYPFEGSVDSGVTVADGAVFAVDTGGKNEPNRLRVLA